VTKFPFPTGAIPSPLDDRDYPVARRVATAVPLPPAFRLSRLPVVTNQYRGSCVTHAMTGVAGYDEIHEAGGTVRLDPEPWYDELREEQGQPGAEGLVVRDALMSWLSKGPPMLYGQREHYRISAFYAVPTVLTAIKQALYQLGHPVLLVNHLATAWGDTTPSGQLAPIDTYEPQDQWTNQTHLWWAWGWDDRASLGLLIRSSWSTEFGKNGNCYMTPDQFAASAIEAWYVESGK
jgi:hypothetical protein